MPKKYIKKYKKGPPITSIESVQQRAAIGLWFYWLGRPKHPSIIISQQFRVVCGLVRGGHLYEAIFTDEYINQKGE